MGWASTLKRQAHRVDFDGNAFFVRSLNVKEFQHVNTLDDEQKDDQLLRYGVCDEVGRPVIGPDEDLQDVPMSVRHGLIYEILEKSIPSKKGLLRSIANSGDLQTEPESVSGNLKNESLQTN